MSLVRDASLHETPLQLWTLCGLIFFSGLKRFTIIFKISHGLLIIIVGHLSRRHHTIIRYLVVLHILFLAALFFVCMKIYIFAFSMCSFHSSCRPRYYTLASQDRLGSPLGMWFFIVGARCFWYINIRSRSYVCLSLHETPLLRWALCAGYFFSFQARLESIGHHYFYHCSWTLPFITIGHLLAEPLLITVLVVVHIFCLLCGAFYSAWKKYTFCNVDMFHSLVLSDLDTIYLPARIG